MATTNKKSGLGIVFLVVGGFLFIAPLIVYLFILSPLDMLYADLALSNQASGLRNFVVILTAVIGLVLFFIGYKQLKLSKSSLTIFILVGLIVLLAGYIFLHLDDRLKGQREANETWYKNVYPTIQYYQNNPTLAPTQ